MATIAMQKNFKNTLRQLDVKRRNISQPLEQKLLKLLSTRRHTQTKLIPVQNVKSVLIVRNNIRIGNMFFLIPFIHEVKRTYPNAKVDLLLTEQWQGEIFKNLGLNQIIYSHFRFKSMHKCIQKLQDLRKTDYDVLLTPYNGSSDLLVASQVKAKNSISFHSKRTEILFSHTFKPSHHYKHYALKPLALLQTMKPNSPVMISPHMQFSIAEITQAKKTLLKLTSSNTQKINLAFFRGARGDKVIEDAKWAKILKKFTNHYKEINFIEIISDDIPTPFCKTHIHYQNSNLRELAAFLQQVDLFICADTGPLHLANAANANSVGLYNKTKIDVYGALGDNALNITDIESLNPLAIMNHFMQKSLPFKAS